MLRSFLINSVISGAGGEAAAEQSEAGQPL